MNFFEEHPNPWTTKKIEQVYDNPWISLTHREVVNPSGKDGIYGVVHFKNLAIGVVPLDREGNTWLVGQYRYTLDKYSWEIPEGGCPLGTDPLETAKRELKEETGMSANDWMPILDLHPSNSVTDEAGMVFLATGLTHGDSQPEETEDLKVEKVSLKKALELIDQGVITDALSVIGLYRVYWLLREGKLATISFPS